MAHTSDHRDVDELIRAVIGEHSVALRRESLTSLQAFMQMREIEGVSCTLLIEAPRKSTDPFEIRLLTGKYKITMATD